MWAAAKAGSSFGNWTLFCQYFQLFSGLANKPFTRMDIRLHDAAQTGRCLVTYDYTLALL
jgi:hypothetical protein